MRQAQLAIEDHRYYEHGALDVNGTFDVSGGKLAGVADSASTGSFAPTAQQIAVRDELVSQARFLLDTYAQPVIAETFLPGAEPAVHTK